MDRSDGKPPLLSRAAVDRRQFLRGIAAAGAVAGAGGLLAACGGSSPSTTPSAASAVKKRGGFLKVGLTGGSGNDTLDPHNGFTFLDTARAQSLYNPLVQLDLNAQTEYVLAESITAKTPTEFIIKLRPGIHFHDGKPLTADDVIYTFRRIKNGNSGAGFSGANALGPVNLAGLKALDKLTVRMPMTAPFASLIDQMAFWYYLYIIPDGLDPLKDKPNGTGPFMYQSFTGGQRSVFTRNPNYWRHGLPWVDSVAIIDFSDNIALQDALSTGAIHAAGSLEGPQIAALSNTSGVRTVVSQTGAITPFTMRVDYPPFRDQRVRQALRLLVNRQQLIDSALDGYGVVASDVYSPYDPDFDHSLHRIQDIHYAKFLLKQAGHEKLSVQLVTSAVATGTVAMATVLAEQAKAAGVTITLNTVTPSDFFHPGKYLSWPFSQDFYNYSPYLAQTSQSMLKTSPFNETHTSNRQKLYDQANSTLDPVKRKQIVTDMQKLDFDTGGYIIPAFIDGLDAYSTQITGYERGSKAGQPLSNLDFQYFAFV